jgi:hypothetical protein
MNDLEVYTREQLTPGSGEERNNVAMLLFQTGVDVLNDFAHEAADSPGRPTQPRANTAPTYQPATPLNGDSQRLYA